MTLESQDLTIDTALADPLIQAAMRADGVDAKQLEKLLRVTAKRLPHAPARQQLFKAPVWTSCSMMIGACYA